MDFQSSRKFIEEKRIQNIKRVVTDYDGVLRGKYVQKKKFDSALENGFGVCDVTFGWNTSDSLYSNDSFTGWHTAFPDVWAHIDSSSGRMFPTEDNQSMLFSLENIQGGPGMGRPPTA